MPKLFALIALVAGLSALTARETAHVPLAELGRKDAPRRDRTLVGA